MQRHFKFELKIRHTEKVLKEGMAPGVFLRQMASFTGTEEELDSARFVGSLLQHRDDFLERNVDVIMTECNEDGSPLNAKGNESGKGRKADGEGVDRECESDVPE